MISILNLYAMLHDILTESPKLHFMATEIIATEN